MAVAPSVARLCAAQGEHQMSVCWTAKGKEQVCLRGRG